MKSSRISTVLLILMVGGMAPYGVSAGGRPACHKMVNCTRCQGRSIAACTSCFYRHGGDPADWVNCECNGSYKYPVPPLYTYHWRGMYSQELMTNYHSPWRFPPLKPYYPEPSPGEEQYYHLGSPDDYAPHAEHFQPDDLRDRDERFDEESSWEGLVEPSGRTQRSGASESRPMSNRSMNGRRQTPIYTF